MNQRSKRRLKKQAPLLRRLRVIGRLVRPRGKAPGAPPGTMVHTGARRVEQVRFEIFRYAPDSFEEEHPDSAAACFPMQPSNGVTWINVDGLHDTAVLGDLAQRAQLHPLVQEDLVSVGQRPKVEEYGDQLYIVLRMLAFDDADREIDEEQLSLVLGPGYVLSFQEQPGDAFDPVRERLRNGRGALRARGADYLAYALIDAVIDEYFLVVEKVGDRLDALENELAGDPTHESLREMHHWKRELLVMRRAVWPLREMLSGLVREDDHPLITPQTRVFLRDAYDHTIQVMDTVETLRDLVSSMTDLYHSIVSNRLNEVMKVLTIIATIFIPLTFVAGVYGMNFDWMPELRWRFGYPAVLGVMLVVAIGMLAFFRRRSWL